MGTVQVQYMPQQYHVMSQAAITPYLNQTQHNNISLSHKAITHTRFLLTHHHSFRAMYTPNNEKENKIKDPPDALQGAKIPQIVKKKSKGRRPN